MTLEAPSFHLHQLLPRQPEHAAARLRDDAQGHRVARDTWTRYSGTACWWFPAPQHDWHGVGEARDHPLHWRAYTYTAPYSGQLDGLLWVAELGSGLRAVVLARAMFGEYGFAVGIVPVAGDAACRKPAWSWAAAHEARAGAQLLDLAHAHALVRPGSYPKVLRHVVRPARKLLGLPPCVPYDPRDFATEVVTAVGMGRGASNGTSHYTNLYTRAEYGSRIARQPFVLAHSTFTASGAKRVMGEVARSGPLACVELETGLSCTLVWVPEPGEPADASRAVFGDHAGALAPATMSLAAGQPRPLWAGTLGGWWSPITFPDGSVKHDFTRQHDVDTFQLALARWQAEPASWNAGVVAECYRVASSGGAIANALVAMLPD